MHHKLTFRQRFTFRCFVCKQPINPRPRKELPVDPVQAFNELKEGRKPDTCCSCGGGFNFKRYRRAFSRYIEYLAMYVPEDMAKELKEMF